MKLDFIETRGFRGFRNGFRLQFAPTFTIVHGRNGVGKSTICDAIEFAISGTINKYRIEKAANETLGDYLWSKLEPPEGPFYVKLGILDEASGQRTEVTRLRDGSIDADGASSLAALVSESSLDIGDAIRQLVKTTILRDEWIAEQSLDLSEYERFRFVASTLGSIDISAILSGNDEATKRMQSLRDVARRELQGITQTSLQQQAELAKLRAEADKGSIADAALALSRLLGIREESIKAGSDEFRSAVLKRRASLQEVINISVRAKRQLRDEYQILEDRLSESLLDIRAAIAKAQASSRELSAQVDELRKSMEGGSSEEIGEHAQLLLSLAQLGKQLGLINGHCPLCRSDISAARFQDSIRTLEAEATKNEGERARKRSELARTAFELNTQLALRRDLEQKARELESKIDEVLTAGKSLRKQAASAGLQLGFPIDLAALDADVDRLSSEVATIENATAVIDASRLTGRINELSSTIETARKAALELEYRIQRSTRGLNVLAESRRAILRTNNEILDERLAEISPLLEELYRRLRPHNEWHTIQYQVRGDVRRFLNLRVGEDLNPQFIFSSGQRRATGLAFLLAVHLARGWGLRSLVLDDPVQHIDDYRAMNLVEVLAAISRHEHQIICAVEDEQLAKLLARRLRAGIRAPGSLVRLDTTDDGLPAATAEPVFASTSRSLQAHG